MNRREKFVRLADVVMLAASKAQEVAEAQGDGIGARVWALSTHLNAVANEFLALAEEERSNQQLAARSQMDISQ